MSDPRLTGAFRALQALKGSIDTEADDWPTRAYNGWIEKVGDALDDDMSHLMIEPDHVPAAELLASIDMALAYLGEFIEQS